MVTALVLVDAAVVLPLVLTAMINSVSNEHDDTHR